MAVQKTDRNEVVSRAFYLFRVNGYHRTSMADISAACGLLKGSMYHYFPSKEALGVAVIEQVLAENHEKIFALTYDDSRPATERLTAVADALEDYFCEREGGCLMGNLALEVSNTVPEFTGLVRRYFDESTAALAHILTPRYGAERAKELAQDSLARIQGAIMLTRLGKNPAPLLRATRDLRGLLAA